MIAGRPLSDMLVAGYSCLRFVVLPTQLWVARGRLKGGGASIVINGFGTFLTNNPGGGAKNPM